VQLGAETRQFDALELVSESLTESSDPQLLNSAASFFIQNSRFDRAVNILALAKRVRRYRRCLQSAHRLGKILKSCRILKM